MSNNPYPSKTQLRCEATAETLLDEQRDSTLKFYEIMNNTLAAVGKLSFPLGFPVLGYDFCDVQAEIQAWVHSPVPDMQIQRNAMDLALAFEVP